MRKYLSYLFANFIKKFLYFYFLLILKKLVLKDTTFFQAFFINKGAVLAKK